MEEDEEVFRFIVDFLVFLLNHEVLLQLLEVLVRLLLILLYFIHTRLDLIGEEITDLGFES